MEVRQRAQPSAPSAPPERNPQPAPLPSAREEAAYSWAYIAIRTVVVLLVFVVLHRLFSAYVLDPYLHHRAAAPPSVEELMQRLCPPGAECDFH